MLFVRTRLTVMVGAILVLGIAPCTAEEIVDANELCLLSRLLLPQQESVGLASPYCQVTEDPDPIFVMPVSPRPSEETEVVEPFDAHFTATSELGPTLPVSEGRYVPLWLALIVR